MFSNNLALKLKQLFLRVFKLLQRRQSHLFSYNLTIYKVFVKINLILKQKTLKKKKWEALQIKNNSINLCPNSLTIMLTFYEEHNRDQVHP